MWLNLQKETILNLVLFSGGVESTCLLRLVSSSDIIISINSPYKQINTYTKNSEHILDYYKLKREYVDVTVPCVNGFVHQLDYFIPIAILIHHTIKFKEIWIGRCVEDMTPEILQKVDNLQKGLSHFCDVKINHPLDYLTKQQQYDLIPNKIKPYVMSCIYENNCGRCHKCEEKNSLISQSDI